MGRIIAMPLPRLGETMDEGRIGLIIKKPGEAFRRGEVLLEVESDKTTVEVPALQDGILVEWLVESDQMVPVESAIALIEIEGEAISEAKAPASTVAPSPPKPAPMPVAGPAMRRDEIHLRPRASTAARAAARRANVDLASLFGTGRNGRITGEDVAAASRPARATYHVETPNGNIFVREWPATARIKGIALLVHGLFADSQSFTTLGRKLAAAGYRTLAVDLPGHGETQSPASTLTEISAAIAAALPLAKLHIVGHSFGAAVAVHLADRAASLTLLSPAGCGEDISAAFMAAMLAGNMGSALEFLGETIPPEAVAGFAEHLSRHGSRLRQIAANVADDGKQTVSILTKLEALSIPVTAVFLRDDRVIPAHHALNLPANVATRFMKGASHLPHWRDPDLIARLVAAAS